jgi:hypothetical protein
MMVLAGASAVIDLRLLGFGRGIPLRSMGTLFQVIWGGFVLNAITGTMLFIADATKRANDPYFALKMVLIALGLATVVMTRRTIFAGDQEPATIPGSAKLLAAASLVFWGGAITAGRLLAYVA